MDVRVHLSHIIEVSVGVTLQLVEPRYFISHLMKAELGFQKVQSSATIHFHRAIHDESQDVAHVHCVGLQVRLG